MEQSIGFYYENNEKAYIYIIYYTYNFARNEGVVWAICIIKKKKIMPCADIWYQYLDILFL